MACGRVTGNKELLNVGLTRRISVFRKNLGGMQMGGLLLLSTVMLQYHSLDFSTLLGVESANSTQTVIYFPKQEKFIRAVMKTENARREALLPSHAAA